MDVARNETEAQMIILGCYIVAGLCGIVAARCLTRWENATRHAQCPITVVMPKGMTYKVRVSLN